jgi:hypothetical protein
MASSFGAADSLGNDDANSSTPVSVKCEAAEVGDEDEAPLLAATAQADDAPKSGEVAPPVYDHTAEVRFPSMPSDQPVCSKCKTQLDGIRVQITGKKAGVWRCSTCCTRATQLHRVFGTTSPDGLKDLTADEQADFWKQIGMTTGDRTALAKCVAERITTRKTEQDKAEAGGQYLPLSVYDKQGYDIDKIKDSCKDTEEHPILGTCYRVSINGGWKSTLDERTRDKTYTGSSGSNKRARSASASPRRTSRGGTAVTGKGKDKGKKNDTAKDKAAKEKVAAKKLQEKESAKEVVANMKVANKVLTKVAVVRFALQETSKLKTLTTLPDFALEALKASKDMVESIDKAAKSSLKSGAPLEWSMAEIDCYIADAKSHDTIVNQLLVAAKVLCKKEK